MSQHELQYSYDGWLVFNELLSTEIHGVEGRPDVDDIVRSFNTYNEGMPADEESGFKRLPIEQDLKQIEDLSHQLSDLSGRLRAFRFVDENWVEQWGYDKHANEQLYYTPNHDEVDVFWEFESGAMMMKGDEQLIERKRSALRGALSGDLKLNSVEFEYDFFLWLLYKEYKGGELDPGSDLHIRNLTRGDTVEGREHSDEKVSVEGKEDILKSVVMIAPLLGGRRIEQLQGTFILGSKQIEAQMKFGGRVHVLVTDNPMSAWEDARRMGLSVLFLSELINLYQLWSNLDPDQKYPPPSFFDDLGDNAKQEGWGLRFDPKEVKQEVARKRQGVVDDDDSDGDPAVA